MKCRHCTSELISTFLDLGYAPPSNAYLGQDSLTKPEKFYPLKVMVCNQCWLVQTEDYAKADELFNSEYAYFSSTSKSWVKHSKEYVNKMIKELALNERSLVIEIASNDGYLLKNFVEEKIPCFGIEPTEGPSRMAESLGIRVLQEFFGEKLGEHLAEQGQKADLILGNNVYAHVPDVNDFTLGLKALLKPKGTITLEFPHLMRLIEFNQFDTIYHEHFSYLSLYTVERIFNNSGLRVFNVEELPTHGGSLRIYGCHIDDARETMSPVEAILCEERERGLQKMITYKLFQEKAEEIKNNFLRFLLNEKIKGKVIAGYGAAAKGNTLINFSGVKIDLLPFIADAALSKQGKFCPGSHIPILSPHVLRDYRPDYLIVFPWNILTEVMENNSDLKAMGTKFVTFIPTLKIL